ncbi:MAG: 23S ribosomal RNA methyltransferase Erm [Chloroflexi bacterium]|nr:23S ribosomal RNA methyltransferase Erm [Chloroflexota bacterium]
MSNKRLTLAQNFFKSPALVRNLVAASTIGQTDTVVEIGPGAGIITQALAGVAQRVVAIEKDPVLVRQLRGRFRHAGHVEIIEGDFLEKSPPLRNYKIFANIPFNLTAKIMQKIIDTPHPPAEAYLVMQKEAAQKFAGSPHETQFSILAKPWFDLQMIHNFQREDFDPIPNVEAVFLQIKKRGPPLVAAQDAPIYQKFVQYGFGGWRKSLRLTYKPFFTYHQWKRLWQDLQFPAEATPTQLSFEQWLGLFACFTEHVPDTKQKLIFK